LKNISWRGKAIKTRSFEKIREIHLQTLFLILKRKNLQTGVKIQVFLSPFIFTCDIYYEIIAPNILIVSFSLFSFSYIEACTHHGIVCICSNCLFYVKLSLVMWFCYVNKRNGWLCNIRNFGMGFIVVNIR